MKVLFLPNNVAGVNFWRMKQFSDKMNQKGVRSYIYRYNQEQTMVGDWEHMMQNNVNIREQLYDLLKSCDVGIVQYLHFPLALALVSMFRKEFNKKLLAEIDDEVIDTPDYNPAFKGGWTPGNPYERVVIEHLKISSGIITSTDFLNNYYRQFNKQINTIPNCIDFDKWNHKKAKSKKLRIGWIGGGNHEEDLRIMEDIIPEICKRYKNVEFYFAHGVPQYLKNMKGVKWDTEWANIDEYPQRVASLGFDIGLAPLVMNKFNQAKSNLRWLEYSAYNIPTVATKIDPYERSITNGQTGILCDSLNEWIEGISTLIENESMRMHIGENAHTSIQEKFNLDKVTDRYIKVLRSYK